MPESAPADAASRSPVDIRAFLANLNPEELGALRDLLAGPPGATSSSGEPATISYVPKAPVQSFGGADAAGRGCLTTPLDGADGHGVAPASLNAPSLPGYEIVREIGRGGMGVVYEARQERLNRLVAVKMILAGAAAGEQELARFRAEAQALARLQHSHIVQVFEVGECAVGSATCPYMVLELCHGGSLTGTLDGTPWKAEEAARLIELLARAVHVAHLAGVVHRDLKPGNVLLARQSPGDAGDSFERNVATARSGPLTGWTPKITDFGLAKCLDEGGGQTQTGAILGTPEYMAPEQASGDGKAVGPGADVYALGAILYELLTGRPPFQGAGQLETMLLVMEREPVPPRATNPAIPRELETVCLKCLGKESGQRYGSALDLADDLRRHLDGEPIVARPPGLLERADRAVKRRPGLAVAFVGLVIALAVFLKMHGFYVPTIFLSRGVSVAGFDYVAVPVAALVMGLLLLTDLRFASCAGAVLAAGWAAVWFAVPDWRPESGSGWLSARALAGPGLLAALIGSAPRPRPLLLLFPALLLGLGGSWLTDGGPVAFQMGVCHGLVLGLIGLLVAWGIRCDRAACVLGAAAGACAGLLLTDWYGMQIRAYLRDSGLRPWPESLVSLYLEALVAFATALVAGLLLDKRPGQKG